jgi:hypothetical protein
MTDKKDNEFKIELEEPVYKEIEVILPEPERECKLSNQELIFFGLMFSYFVTVMIFAYYLAA